MRARPGVALVRVDNRLVHGQVLEAWVPALDADALLVADDEAAGNVLARSAMSLAIPSRLRFSVLRIAAAADLLRPGGQGAPGARTLVLVRDVRDAESLAGAGVPLAALNLGNVHFAAGRRAVTASVHLSPGEVAALERLAAAGTQIEARAVPNEAAVPLAAIRERVARG